MAFFNAGASQKVTEQPRLKITLIYYNGVSAISNERQVSAK